MLGQGHDSAFLRELAQMLIDEGSPAVAIDPNAKSARARRAYARAGFEGDEIVNAAEGPVVVMVFRDRRPDPRLYRETAMNALEQIADA